MEKERLERAENDTPTTETYSRLGRVVKLNENYGYVQDDQTKEVAKFYIQNLQGVDVADLVRMQVEGQQFEFDVIARGVHKGKKPTRAHVRRMRPFASDTSLDNNRLLPPEASSARCLQKGGKLTQSSFWAIGQIIKFEEKVPSYGHIRDDRTGEVAKFKLSVTKMSRKKVQGLQAKGRRFEFRADIRLDYMPTGNQEHKWIVNQMRLIDNETP